MPVQSPESPSRVYDVDPNFLVPTGQTDVDMGITSSLRGGRTPLFDLCRIPDTINAGDTVINRGRNSWRVRMYHYTTGLSNLQQDPSPTLADLADPRGTNPQVYFRYQPVEFDLTNQYPSLSPTLVSALRLPNMEYPLQGTNDRVMHCFSARIVTNPTLNDAQLAALSSTSISMPAIFSNHRGTVYLNGSPVPLQTQYNPLTASVSVTMTLPFKPGTNYLQIVTNNYAALSGKPFNFGDGVFSVWCVPNGQLTWYADDGPMNEVSLYELQFQTSRNDFSRYAVVDDTVTDDQLIIVRELPTTCYDIVFTEVDSSRAPTSLVLRATLTGDSSNVTITPKISNFSVLNTYV